MENTKKYRIFIFHPYPDIGGADRSIIRLINGQKNHEIILITLKKANYDKFLNKKINYILLKSNRVLFCIFELYKIIKKKIYKEKYKKDIFISNQNFANIITILTLRTIKTLKIILIERNHLNELKTYNNYLDLIKKIIILFFIKKTYKYSDKIVGISKELSRDLYKFTGKKVITIYNAAANRLFFINKKKFFINFFNKIKNKNIILNVGRLENQKNQLLILKSLIQLNGKINNYHVIFIGNGQNLILIKNFIKINKLQKNVSIFKNIIDTSEFYKNCDLFILSSNFEGFANVLVEALMYKCPVISSDCSSGPKEILKNGKFGTLFKNNNYLDLSKKIYRHFKNPDILQKKSLDAQITLKKYSLKENNIKFTKLFDGI